jgi:diaminohydroxyphosphoribosylaminopyrimidine deaminase/5-amino-6-(5-phosphoribosylamino)uracil reductase
MNDFRQYMERCIELAGKGRGSVAPNPMVGCVIVHDGKIIGEGYHQQYGGPHAEVNAIRSVQDTSLLPESTLFVNLEPCSHFGKTPPCADLIIEKKIGRVVIASIDPNPKVAGQGIQKLKDAGVKVFTGILDEEARELNRRFFTFQEKKRPYIILKWAKTQDDYISKKQPAGKADNWITSEESKKLVHQWRSEEQAILVGTNTVLFDNPLLTVRLVAGKNPVRLVIDRHQKIAGDFHIFSPEAPTVIFTEIKSASHDHAQYVVLDFTRDIIPQLLEHLHGKNILSVIVEGGGQLLQSFIKEGFWDEARIFTGEKFFGEGNPAPQISGKKISENKIGTDELVILRNL